MPVLLLHTVRVRDSRVPSDSTSAQLVRARAVTPRRTPPWPRRGEASAGRQPTCVRRRFRREKHHRQREPRPPRIPVARLQASGRALPSEQAGVRIDRLHCARSASSASTLRSLHQTEARRRRSRPEEQAACPCPCEAQLSGCRQAQGTRTGSTTQRRQETPAASLEKKSPTSSQPCPGNHRVSPEASTRRDES